MPWTDVTPAIGVDRPIRASTHLAMYANFAALAAGDPGAPLVRIPQAVRTDATNQNLVLRPDGSGGVQWAAAPPLVASWNRGPAGTTAVSVASGTHLVLAHGLDEDDEDQNTVYLGFALVSSGTIQFDSTVQVSDNQSMGPGDFSVDSGGIYFRRPNGSSVVVDILAIRIG